MKGHKMMVGRCSGVCVQEVLQCRKLQWGIGVMQQAAKQLPHRSMLLLPQYTHSAFCMLYTTLWTQHCTLYNVYHTLQWMCKKNHSLRKLHTVNYTKKYSTFCAVHVTLCIEQCSAVQCSIQCALHCSVVCSAVCSAVAPIVQKLMAALPTHPLPCLLNTGISMHHSLV